MLDKKCQGDLGVKPRVALTEQRRREPLACISLGISLDETCVCHMLNWTGLVVASG